MTPALAMIAWIVAGAQSLREKLRARLGKPVAQNNEALRDVAQLQDHCRPSTRRPKPRAIAQKVDDLRVLLGPRIDGGTCWIIQPPVGRRTWARWADLQDRITAGATTVEIVDHEGEVATMQVERKGSTTILRTGRTRWTLRRKRAEVAIRSEAAEVEGVESWYERELPRAIWWLLGVDLGESEDLPADLAALGVQQRRIELCLDCVGLPVIAGLNDRLISAASVSSYQRRSGELDGVGAGGRDTTPCSIAIYAKGKELARQRGPVHAALIERMTRAGLAEGDEWTRIELRCWGGALQLEGLDATHPGAALDGELLGRLWSSGLTRHWLAAPRAEFLARRREWEDAGREGEGPRMRDEPEDGRWRTARAAGATAEPLRLSRDVAARQRQATTDHARARLVQAAADTEELLDGTGSGLAAIVELERSMAGPGWSESMARARARYADVIRDGGES